jgi:hypothetical protein
MSYMKTPCKHCPYRNDVTPYLTNERAEQLAYAPSNQYNTFPCHKTTEYDAQENDMMVTEESLECAGFLTMRAQFGLDVPEGFEPAWDICYTDETEMIDAYERHNEEI